MVLNFTRVFAKQIFTRAVGYPDAFRNNIGSVKKTNVGKNFIKI